MSDTLDRLKNAWNALFDNRQDSFADIGIDNYSRPDRIRISNGNERSIIASIYTRIAIDCAKTPIRHVRLDQNDRFVETIESGLNECLTISANTDQTGRAFLMDAVLSLFDEGVIAIVPVTKVENSSGFDILSLRTGKIISWYPYHVKVEAYNEATGKKQTIVCAKDEVAIVENPFYSVFNEPNSTLKRLVNKLNLLDTNDQNLMSGKLDLIIQLPYVIKTATRKEQAEARRKDIEDQLAGSKYGIAYTDGTERITQLNRPAENNLMTQITYLTAQLYNQLGLTEAVFNGTADEKAMLNYYNRTIDPVLTAFTDSMSRVFLTKTARTQKQALRYFRDPFGLVPVSDLANVSDSLTRNEVLSSNEVRGLLGFKPSTEEGSDDLRNKNLKTKDTTGAIKD